MVRFLVLGVVGEGFLSGIRIRLVAIKSGRMMRRLNSLLALLLFSLMASATGCFLAPVGIPSSSTAPQQEATGRVLGLDGKPAANVAVRGYIVSNNGSSLVSNNSASLVSNNAAGYRVLAEQLETRTDANGTFSLHAADGAALNIEAALSDDVKAIQFNVSEATRGLEMQLAYTGAISGRVQALDRPEVTNLQGVDVYVPGTSYLAKTDEGGRFTITNVAVGLFGLTASKAGLGTAALAGIEVKSKNTTAISDLQLSLKIPAVIQVVPANAGPGATVTLSGANFGTTSGDLLQVLFSGTPATQVQRVDDTTLKAIVPGGAETGDIVLSVGGVPGHGYPFSVLKSLRLDPGNAILTPGDQLPVSVFALDTRGDVVANPSLTWNLTGTAVSLDNGIVSAGSTGEALLKVSSGRVASLRKLTVLARYPSVSLLAGSSRGYADGTGAAAQFDLFDLLVTRDGRLLVTDSNNHRLRCVTLPDAVVTTFAGDGTDENLDGTLATAKMRMPLRLARDPQSDDMYLADAYDVIRKITPGGQVTTFAGTGVTGYQDGPVATAQFSNPSGIAVDDHHNVFVVDRGNHCIRKITPEGQVSTFAGNIHTGNFDGFRGSARFEDPSAIVRDGNGCFYISDTMNHNIRKMTPDGLVTTLAGSGQPGYYDGNGAEASFKSPYGLAVDDASRVYVSDFMNDCIRMITPDGMVTTYAGSGAQGDRNGPAPTAQFHYPAGLTIDASGRLYVTEFSNSTIRRIEP